MPIALLVMCLLVLSTLTFVGVRMLISGCSRRSIPELALAAFFLVGGTVAFGCELAARELVPESLEWQARLRTVVNLASCMAAVAIALFTWRVFRPGERWAAWLFGVIAGIQLSLSMNLLATGRSTSGTGAAFWIGVLITILTLVWAMGDSFAYYRTGVRRVALGLSDAVVTNRFLLWSVWSATAILIVVGKVSSVLLFGVDAAFTPLRIAMTLWQAAVGLTCVTAMALTFYPPAAYKAWIESRSAAKLASS